MNPTHNRQLQAVERITLTSLCQQDQSLRDVGALVQRSIATLAPRATAYRFATQLLLAVTGSFFGRSRRRVSDCWRAVSYHLLAFPLVKVA